MVFTYFDIVSFSLVNCVSYFIIVIPAQVIKKGGEILLTAKAYNNRCIMEWLRDVMQRAYQQSGDPRMPLAYLCMNLDALAYSRNL